MKLVFLILVFYSQSVFALNLQQAPPPVNTSESSEGLSFGPKRQIATIVYCGLAGAVLGLSTLSFYGRPQDYLSNIAIGFGAGVIIGTIYMTWNAATNPDEFYNSTLMREQERDRALATFAPQPPSPLRLQYRWSF